MANVTRPGFSPGWPIGLIVLIAVIVILGWGWGWGGWGWGGWGWNRAGNNAGVHRAELPASGNSPGNTSAPAHSGTVTPVPNQPANR